MIRNCLLISFICFIFQSVAVAQWEPPFDYYANATGNGAVLKEQLEAAMTDGHIEARYGDFRFSAAIHDADPLEPGKIILNYNRESAESTWDSGVTWNREHVWPQSRQPGSASNSTRGNLGDPHALRPITPSINSSRGNNPFGFGNTTGEFGNNNGFWYPGDECPGDVARSLFYSDTRWSSLGLTLVNGTPSGNQMGDLTSLIQWHFIDPPDEFERRRNHTIFSSQFNPDYFTNNRNAYIDRPELVWSVYVGQENDSTIAIEEGQEFADGGSILEIDFGEVERGTIIDSSVAVTLNKSGMDGTYYSVISAGNVTTDRDGRNNAFTVGSPGSQQMIVTLDYDANQPGDYSGAVMVDNLDITTQGGVGNGANDSDDLISVSIRVIEPLLLGDVNCDGAINLLDVSPLIDLIISDQFSPKADMNSDGAVNLLDIDPFVELLAGG